MNESHSLDSLVRGHEFPSMNFRLDRAEVDAYLDAVGDRAFRAAGGGDTVPPLAVAAFALRSLLASFRLPEGSVHTGEEIELARPVRIGEELRCEARVANASDRQGYRFSSVEQQLIDAAGDVVLLSKAALMSPLAESARS